MFRKKSKYKHVQINKKKYYFYKISWLDITADGGHATREEFDKFECSRMVSYGYVYKKTKKVISEIKSNSSPRFLEFETYRWREHCGPNYDNDIGYRSEKEFLKWKDRDPIKIIEEKLIEKGHLLSSEIIDIDSSLNAEVEKAFTYAENSPFPDPDDAYNDIYSEA